MKLTLQEFMSQSYMISQVCEADELRLMFADLNGVKFVDIEHFLCSASYADCGFAGVTA